MIVEASKTICAAASVGKPKKCPNCKTLNAPSATVCKKCKAELPETRENDSTYDPYK